VGSNSIRQIIADVSADGAIRVLDEMKAAPRLAAGMSATGELDTRAISRAAESLSRMTTLAKQFGAQRIQIVATSAVRDADNADAFRRAVRDATGLGVRILDGDEEARLAFRSALAHFDLGASRAAVMDIGGGSLELALSARGVIERMVSLPLGALRLTEQFVGDECSRRDVRRLRKHVREILRAKLPAREWRGAEIIGSGGTVSNLAGMTLARRGMQAAHTVHGTRVSRGDVEHLLDALEDTSLEERQSMPALNPARADIIVAGLAVIAEVLARLDAHDLVVSAYGIREGLLLEAARVTPSIANPGDARRRSVTRFAEACRFEEPHANHVRTLALQLFDKVGERLGCVAADRQILSDAALLHDVGYHVSYDKHHKHSYYLIAHAELLGMSPAEQIVVANVARYHRGREPRRRHRGFEALDGDLRRQVRRLAAILRLADGLDRGHAGAIDHVRVRWSQRALRLTPMPRPGFNIRLEVWGAARKAGLLAKLVGMPVEIVDGKCAVLASAGERGASHAEAESAAD
jgi:exopolyphosphatase/guanosine-5'-triphosphate,3'-diphosphate pyrophosphatase